jgi:hypothetical protein
MLSNSCPILPTSTVEILTDQAGTMLIDLYDAEGRLCLSASAQGHNAIDVSSLLAGKLHGRHP